MKLSGKTQCGFSLLLLLSVVSFSTSSAFAAAVLQNAEKSVEVPATVKGIQTVDLYSKVGGFLKVINVDIGDEFKAGQALAELDIPEMASDIRQKEALVQQTEAEAQQAIAAVKEAKAQMQGFRAAIDEA